MQLTDGEVTLRDERELVQLLRRAHELELVPMLMTHGDAFRRRPGLLERLVVEGGLREVCLHVDTTQRGRMGGRWDRARSEEQLDGLRDELAAIVRAARERSGLPLRVASTVSVAEHNLDGVAAVLRWARRNPDVLRIVSFQPLAQVGRTEQGLGGRVDLAALWRRIALGLCDDGQAAERLEDARLWFGHPDCSRVVMGVLAAGGAGPAAWHPRTASRTRARRVPGATCWAAGAA